MPKKPDTGGSEDQAPAIDPQKKYLMDQFGSLMEKVGDGFGIPLQQELVDRLLLLHHVPHLLRWLLFVPE